MLTPEEAAQSVNYNHYSAASTECIATFFKDHMSRFIYFIRWPVILFGFGWLFITIVMGVSIPRKTRSTDVLGDSMRVQQAKYMAENLIGQAAEYTDIDFVFGLKTGIYNLDDEDPGTYWARTFPGVPIFDAYFDASPEENQHKLDLLCNQLLAMD